MLAAAGIDPLLDLADPWGYLLVFLLALAEGAALIGLFLPGESAMLLGGVLVYQGRAELAFMLLIGCTGSVIGDSIGFWVGRRFGPAIRSSRLGRKVGDEKWDSGARYLRERGAKAVFFGRFLGFLRTLVPPLAGSSGMPYSRFVMFNAPAAAIWAAMFILIGLAAGRSWEVVDKWAGRASAVLLLVLVLAGIVFFTARWVQNREALFRQRWIAFLRDERVQRLRHRFQPQIDFLRRRLDPTTRFGLYLTAGLAVAALASAGFGAIVDSLSEEGDVAAVDVALLEFFTRHQTPSLDRIVEVLSHTVTTELLAGAIFVGGAVAYVVTRKRRWILFSFAVLGGGLFLDSVAHSLLDLFGIDAGGFGEAGTGSFPSDEATAGGALVGQVAYIAVRTTSWTAAVRATAVACFLALVISLGFVYLGAHTPSSLLAGFLLGLSWAAVSAISLNQLDHLWRTSGR